MAKRHKGGKKLKVMGAHLGHEGKKHHKGRKHGGKKK
jgi:hypothetical protein